MLQRVNEGCSPRGANSAQGRFLVHVLVCLFTWVTVMVSRVMVMVRVKVSVDWW